MSKATDRTVLSLFSGAGGMDIGLEAAGFRQVGMVELDETAQRTLKANRREWRLHGRGDVIDAADDLTANSFGMDAGELDLIAGGPPCQPFSLAAQWHAEGRRGMLDPRADTVGATLKLVKEFAPKFLLIENVIGFIKGAGSALSFVESELKRIGDSVGVKYVVEARVLNSADYGVPQNRRRAILIARHEGIPFAWPKETHAHAPLRVWDAISDLKSETPQGLTGRWADLIPCVPPGQNYQWFTNRGGGPEIFGYRSKFWNFLLKLSPDLPSWTLAASPGPATGPFHWENRQLTIAERKRIQTFPDQWTFSGEFRDVVKQIGNATPPVLAEALGSAILASLNDKDVRPPTLVRYASALPTPTLPPLAPLPPEYNALVGKKLPHAGTGLGPSPRVAR